MLSQIMIYPVKSCAGTVLQEVHLDRFGPGGDRRWMLVDSQGSFVTQREDSRLALIGVDQMAEGLSLSYAGESLAVGHPEASRHLQVQVWDDRVPALDAGDQVARWLSGHFQRDLRLVYMPQDSVRYVDGVYASAGETVGFADGFPLLLISEGSLDGLNARLSQPVPMDRFRPNLVVSGCEPHAEDNWRRIRIGDIEFEVAKACARCVMPSVDQATGEKDSEILKALAAYRRFEAPDGGPRQVYFGQNLLYTGTGKLAVGDPVTILP